MIFNGGESDLLDFRLHLFTFLPFTLSIQSSSLGRNVKYANVLIGDV